MVGLRNFFHTGRKLEKEEEKEHEDDDDKEEEKVCSDARERTRGK
jgi:hypothetical protein